MTDRGSFSRGRSRGGSHGWSNDPENWRQRGDFREQNSDRIEHRPGRGGRSNYHNRGFRSGHAVSDVHPNRPFGYRELQAMVSFEPSKILQLMSDSKKEFESVLVKQMEFGWYALIMRLLAKISDSVVPTVHNELFVDLLMTVSRSAFVKQFTMFLTTIASERKHETTAVVQLHRDLVVFFKVFLEKTPTSACNSVPEKFFEIILTMKTLLAVNNYIVPEEVYAEVRTLQMMLYDARFSILGDQPDEEAQKKLSRLARDEDWSTVKPPNDFRTLNVVPTIEDLTTDERPFLRPALVEHAYRNTDDYLDIQFRLMREDFFYPLRSGIKKYLEIKGNQRSRTRVDDVQIYQGVRFVEYDVVKGSHLISFSLDRLRRVAWDCSKRLMHGSLLCLTSDDFKSGILATVCKRDLKLLPKGQVGIIIEDVKDVRNYEKLTFTMIESSAFFQTYRNILLALQAFKDETFPMKEYVLGKKVGSALPEYLRKRLSENDGEVFYDLSTSVMTVDQLRDRRENLLDLVQELLQTDLRERVAGAARPVGGEAVLDFRLLDSCNSLKQIDIANYNGWPSASQLDFDPSQLEAFRTALLEKCVLIQGPPGTGKTFIGLKIIQTLLQNQSVWRLKEDGTQELNPIVVVCYTNHALDQFLEGILSFTKKVVRIGSMSKNESVQKYSLFELRKRLKDRGIKSYHGRWAYDRRMKMKDILEELLEHDNVLSQVDKKIILHENFLVASTAMPAEFKRLLENGRHNRTNTSSVLSEWLLVDDIQALYHVANLFRDGQLNFRPNPEEPVAPPDQVPQPEVEANEDEFDPEDIEEIARERLAEYDVRPELADLVASIKAENRGARYLTGQSAIAWSEEILNQIINEISFVLSQRNVPAWLYQQAEKDMGRYRRIGELVLDILPVIPQIPVERYEMLLQHDPWTVEIHERWMMYGVWRTTVLAQTKEKRQEMEVTYRKVKGQLEDVQTDEDAHYCRHMDVVGLTTSGCGKFDKLLKHLAAKIVLVEEAAEVQETHVLVSMTSACEHLILIGDHQQLRPPTTVYHLARDYHMDISLFERLIKRGVKHATLSVQHRMRPEIARLIVPAIYPVLANHESVQDLPDVMGIKKNVFFLTHNVPEKEDTEQRSHLNPHEAELALRLAMYLLQQGYTSSQITILTTYSGQLMHMRQLRKNQYDTLLGVRISVVDNFQGEENDIIILSLVRSNVDAKIGFLAIENRVCVALSRAKRGLYIIGNMDSLDAKSKLWQKVRATLTTNEEIGPALELVCQIHGAVTPISNANDFGKVMEGGCARLCLSPLTCGHLCKSVCHAQDRDHKVKRCQEHCERLCSLKHGCKKKCYEDCGRCLVPVDKELPCGHVATIPCYVNAVEYKCVEMVERTLPLCGHEARMACSASVEKFRCQTQCDFRLDCGHSCVLSCHPLNDPGHEEYQCAKPCTKINDRCKQNHTCKKKCYEECGVCSETILFVLPCGHKAKASCGQDMEDYLCLVKVDKKIEDCGHMIKMLCYQTPVRSSCKALKCPRVLPCGHACKKRCAELCSSADCRDVVFVHGVLPCGHRAFTFCNRQKDSSAEYLEDLMQICGELCDAELGCGHKCGGNCGKCFQGRLHIQCKSDCGRVLVCGHVCKQNCPASCPPCKEQCSYKCPHSQCKRKCGDLCSPCQEKCKWACEHKKCKKLCGEKCDRGRCDEPCTKTLPCSHECIGLCGEECPQLCRVCDKEQLAEFILLGNESEPDSRFILLPDCQHVIEIEGMDHWMDQASEEIGAKKCPRCSSIITSYLPRYGVQIRDAICDINRVKRQYHQEKKVADSLRTFRSRLQGLRLDTELAILGKGVDELLLRVESALNKLKNKQRGCFIVLMSDDVLELTKIQVNFVFSIYRELRDAETAHRPEKQARPRNSYHQVPNRYAALERADPAATKPGSPMKAELLDSLRKRAVFLARNLMKRTNFSQQEVNDFLSEIQRLQFQKGLYFIQSSPNFAALRGSKPEFLKSVEELSTLMHGVTKIQENQYATIQSTLKRLSELAATGLGISDSERQKIVTAMGLSKGHWYKCPNGHVYCIGDCGGAMVEARCNECGAAIGGGSHRIRHDNTVATEMDGATQPRWPDPLRFH